MTPRGIKNNNPFNIRISNTPWVHKVIPSTDAAFEQFSTSYDGLHAGITNLLNYFRFHGLNTVRQIITRYAPASENDLNAYVADVCGRNQVGPDDKLDLLNPFILCGLATAIIWHENGQNPYPPTQVMQVVNDVLFSTRPKPEPVIA